MKTASAKHKGRRLQQDIRDKLVSVLNISPQDIESRSMGAGGEDLILSSVARRKFPFSIECKNQERVNVWQSYHQAEQNSRYGEPLLIIKKNKHNPLAVVDFDYLLELIEENELLARVKP